MADGLSGKRGRNRKEYRQNIRHAGEKAVAGIPRHTYNSYGGSAVCGFHVEKEKS